MNKNIQDIKKYLIKRNIEFMEHCAVPIGGSSGVEISRIWADIFIPSKRIVILERPDRLLESLGYTVIVVDEKTGNYFEEIERMLR